jgi:protocatechuate 3,4-dioxygenase beta subunit
MTVNEWTRRELLTLAGSAAAAGLLGCGSAVSGATTSSTPTSPTTTNGTCVMTPQLTEGPYFVDERLNRSDIRVDPSTGIVSAGVPLMLTLRVSQIANNACSALAGAIVDIWHCDAGGVYSDEAAMNSTGKRFLRGYQVTDSSGQLQFTTIYPGWYPGRAVHIHFKVRNALTSSASQQLTSQWFFDDALTDSVHAQSPYSAKGRRDTRNANDGIYNQGGSSLVLALTPSGSGYAGSFDLALRA